MQFSTLKALLRSARVWWNQLPSLWKITCGLLVTGIVSFLAIFFPNLEPLANVPNWVRLAVIIFMFISLLWSLIALWQKGEKSEELERQASRLVEEKSELQKIITGKESEISQLETEKQSLLEIDEVIWLRTDAGANQFVPSDLRRTVIASMLNLKGGVGKTTLTANLAACLSTMNQPIRTLIVDLDFQGTLSDMCVEQQTLTLLRQTKSTVSSLLTGQASIDDLKNLAVPMTGVENAKIVCAADRLDTIDFRLQAQFFLDSNREVRFLLQEIFHDKRICQFYDLVVFDCPPRLTASVINALTCSDFVFIPTKLDRSSVTAVPRTLKWLAKMGRTVQAKPLGVIANETLSRGGKLIADHKNAYDYLSKDLIPPSYGNLVFSNTVAFSNKIAHTKSMGAVASIDDNAQKLFIDVAQEIRERTGL